MQATAARRVAKSIATICAMLSLLLSLFFVQLRYVGMTAGLLPVQKAEASVVARAPHFDGSGTVSVEYCSEVVAGHDADNPSGLHFHEPGVRRRLAGTRLLRLPAPAGHRLFRAGRRMQFRIAVLRRCGRRETLRRAGVGRAWVSTTSAPTPTRLRSGILDEIGALFAGSHDVAAYTLASKTVPGKKGEPPTTILFVGIRGSYGIEWLSNFNFMNPVDADHQGFKAAEREIEEALFDYARERGADPAHTRVLVTGHSRGGAIANLLAARLDDLGRQPRSSWRRRATSSPTPSPPRARPRRPTDRHASYGNVFNIVNESDIVPQLPLSIWGYGRYGTNVALPDATQRDVCRHAMTTCRTPTGATRALSTARMRARLPRWSPSRPKRHATCPTSIRWQARRASSAALQTLAGLDCMAAIDAHCPDTYIAWMQATDPGNLTFRSAHATAPGALQAVA